MLSPKKLFILVMFLTGISMYIALPTQIKLGQWQFSKRPISFEIFGRSVYFNPEINLGLDLQGGTHLVLNADMSQIDEADRLDALDSSKEVISRRVDAFGVAEPVIQTSVNQDAQQYRLIIELPGVSDIDEAISLVGQTAQLDFREQGPNFESLTATASAIEYINSFTPTGLTGQNLQKAFVQFDPKTGQPVVALEFDDQGAELFGQITERNVGRPLGIFIDGFPVTTPLVQAVFTTGEAVITGKFDSQEAKNLAIQLNAGALPVPIEIISQRNVGASLGQIYVQRSMLAGLIGLAMVSIFMMAYYGYLGLLASLTLGIFAVVTLALYKIIGLTLTLPGLAGFILSVGMALDGTILIFERYREEFRSGKRWDVAMEQGFGRAWVAIKDANIATLTICFILFNPFNWNFLNASGMIRGFALTLALGVLLSMFTGVVITRTLIRLFYLGKDTNQTKQL